MAITKFGRKFVKTAQKLEKRAIHNALMGATRASNLSDADKKALRQYYGLPEDASFIARNAGRGFVGGILGGLPGSALAWYGANRFNPYLLGLGGLAQLGGGLYGAKVMTDKYSTGNAQRVKKFLPKTLAEAE